MASILIKEYQNIFDFLISEYYSGDGQYIKPLDDKDAKLYEILDTMYNIINKLN